MWRWWIYFPLAASLQPYLERLCLITEWNRNKGFSVGRRCASRGSTNQNASFVEWFSRLERAVFRVVYGEILALFQAWIGNFDTKPPWKVFGTLILILVTLLLKILLSWAFETSLNCSVMCKPPRWFECYFRRSCWIHCWLLLAVLSDYFVHLVS